MDLTRLIDAVNQRDVNQAKILLEGSDGLVNQCDESGATALHYAARNGDGEMVKLLVGFGAEINAIDTQHKATPTGWAIEYLRQMDGFLATELSDLSYAIRQGDIRWIKRFIDRYPALVHKSDKNGKSFKNMAWESGNLEIARLFGLGDVE